MTTLSEILASLDKPVICLDNSCYDKGHIGFGNLVALNLDNLELLVVGIVSECKAKYRRSSFDINLQEERNMKWKQVMITFFAGVMLLVVVSVVGAEEKAKKVKKMSKNSEIKLSPPMPGEWIKDSNGCNVWNYKPDPGESVTWTGACKKGLATGKGVQQWYLNGVQTASYDGEMKQGLKHGKGTFKWANGDEYSGDFIEGKKSGKGIITWEAKAQHGKDMPKRYEGDFLNDKLHGEGTMYYLNENKFIGSFRNGIREGYGTYYVHESNGTFFGKNWSGTWSNNDRASGDWNGGGFSDSFSSQGSSASSSSCSTSEDCFEVIKTKWEDKNFKSIYIRCVKGPKASPYSEECISYSKIDGKWSDGCVMGTSHRPTLRGSGNSACGVY